MKIFLSHNFNDKPIVENVATRLASIFEQENVFYDSWSIQPGDSIIGKMNEGMEAPDFVFFFISKDSLKSGMVKLEWQNALHKASKGLTKLIPVRLDNSPIPAILTTTAYLDIYQNGLENTLAQIVGICQRQGTFSPEFSNFSNLTFALKFVTETKSLEIEIVANHYVENNLKFVVLSENTNQEISVTQKANGMSQIGTNYLEDFPLNNGQTYKGHFIQTHNSVLKPGFPIRLILGPKAALGDNKIVFCGILHEVAENKWKALPGNHNTKVE